MLMSWSRIWAFVIFLFGENEEYIYMFLFLWETREISGMKVRRDEKTPENGVGCNLSGIQSQNKRPNLLQNALHNTKLPLFWLFVTILCRVSVCLLGQSKFSKFLFNCEVFL